MQRPLQMQIDVYTKSQYEYIGGSKFGACTCRCVLQPWLWREDQTERAYGGVTISTISFERVWWKGRRLGICL